MASSFNASSSAGRADLAGGPIRPSVYAAPARRSGLSPFRASTKGSTASGPIFARADPRFCRTSGSGSLSASTSFFTNSLVSGSGTGGAANATAAESPTKRRSHSRTANPHSHHSLLTGNGFRASVTDKEEGSLHFGRVGFGPGYGVGLDGVELVVRLGRPFTGT